MKGGEVAEGVEAAWISNLTELCPPASRVDARGDDPRDPRPRLTCDFRERMPGCREAQGWRANLSAAELRDPAIPLPYKLEKEGSQARFEAFVRDVLPLAFDPARLTDAFRTTSTRSRADYRCFGYPSAYVEAPAPPDPGHCASLRW
ncbi:hypothetical protein SO694_00037021 [Aureococcus anophagefferens]|uniref:Uncharacterized protein n=1 Tax=Aureococcus anophagefferens TaxID=44056 RepID=A0ABR1FKV0_AURAN